jgi:hypothetical protein
LWRGCLAGRKTKKKMRGRFPGCQEHSRSTLGLSSYDVCIGFFQIIQIVFVHLGRMAFSAPSGTHGIHEWTEKKEPPLGWLLTYNLCLSPRPWLCLLARLV